MPSNKLLARLPRADLLRLEPKLQAVDLPVRQTLQARNKRVEAVYFIESGVASVVANGGHPIEVGMIGREGMTGTSLVLGTNDRVPHETYMQIAGSGLRLSTEDLRAVVRASPALHQLLLEYVQVYLSQITQTALANGRSTIEERLARWLLLAHDRVEGDEIVLTHEFISVMLGTRRAGITLALGALMRERLISYRRSRITIVDRAGLEARANGTYLPANERSKAARKPDAEPLQR